MGVGESHLALCWPLLQWKDLQDKKIFLLFTAVLRLEPGPQRLATSTGGRGAVTVVLW